MPRLLEPDGVTARARALAYEKLCVTPEQISMSPQITPELAVIQKTIRRAGQPRTIRRRTLINQNDSTERVASDILVDEHTIPYGPGCDLKSEWPTYLQSSDHPDARKVLYAYNSIPHNWRSVCPVEAYCCAAGVSPLSILSILVGEVVRRGAQARTIIAMINQPRIVQKMVEVGLTDEGFADRELLARATNFLPAAKGAQTIVQVNANASSTSASDAKSAAIAPPPEQTIRRLVDRFNDTPRLSPPRALELPVASPSNIPAAAESPEEDLIRVSPKIYYDGDEDGEDGEDGEDEEA